MLNNTGIVQRAVDMACLEPETVPSIQFFLINFKSKLLNFLLHHPSPPATRW